ncbi:ATP-dependent DNA helicase pfh1 [Yarrowia sp. B02]|nr:ATP-dependent DNA helicase pfh1 [Yarrowia sp. B02]
MGLLDDLRADAAHRTQKRTFARAWEPERYQRQRLEEGSDTINSLMNQLRRKETEGDDRDEDMMDVDEPEGALPDTVDNVNNVNAYSNMSTADLKRDMGSMAERVKSLERKLACANTQEEYDKINSELRLAKRSGRKMKSELYVREEQNPPPESSSVNEMPTSSSVKERGRTSLNQGSCSSGSINMFFSGAADRKAKAEKTNSDKTNADQTSSNKSEKRKSSEKPRSSEKRHRKSRTIPKPSVQIQDENMFVRDDWWKEWEPLELASLTAYYKKELEAATRGHSGLSHSEETALRLGELKRLVRKDAKEKLLAQYNSLLQEQSVKRENETEAERELVETRNLHTGEPRSGQLETSASDDESEALAANTTTLSLLEPQDVTLTDEQQVVFDLVAQGESLFFTGGAGTGKSVLIKEIKAHCDDQGVVCNVTAPTGLAAVNVGGMTIHRWTGLGLMKEDPAVCIKKLQNIPRAAAIWKYTQVLVIDEASMVSAAMFSKIDTIARAIRSNFHKIAQKAVDQFEKETELQLQDERKKVHNYKFLREMRLYSTQDAERDRHLRDLPFGGIQVVCVGDFYQLSPVPSFEEKNAWAERHKVPYRDAKPPKDYLFHSPAFNAVFGSNRLRLTVAKRQTEGSMFSKMLDLFRRYQGTADEASALRDYFSKFVGEFPPGMEAVHLKPTSNKVDETNQRELQRLDGPEVMFFAEDSFNNEYPQDFIANAMKDFSCEEKLSLKPGAQIMFLQNDYDKGLVNGHMGQVAFLMTFELYQLYKDDIEILFPIAQYIKRNVRSMSQNARVPPELEEHLGIELEHHQWSHYRYALMHIDEVYRQEALAQKNRLKENKRKNTDLHVVFRLADAYIGDPDRDQQYFLVAPSDFEKLDYSRLLDVEDNPFAPEQQPKYPQICKRVQLPIALSWALTIHKAQGQTLIRTVVDMKNMFVEGQAYVAMSRVRSPEDLRLTCFELPKVTCPEVSKFDETIRDALTVRQGGITGFSGFFVRPDNNPHPLRNASPPPSSYESAVSELDENRGHYTSQGH